jgi:hypothetical protein
MDLATIEVVLLNGRRLSLGESLKEVVQALMSDGCVLLKRATNLAPVEPFLLSDMNSLESVRKDIVLNEVRPPLITLWLYVTGPLGCQSHPVLGARRRFSDYWLPGIQSWYTRRRYVAG